MNFFQLEMVLITALVSIATVLPGIFLVLQGTALMSDAISHAILPGIVIMFLIIQQLDSPLLLLGAALAGMSTVVLTQALINTQRIKKDAAIGLVFPLFFSIGVLLISLYTRNVHLDTDMVLLGELAFAPFNRITICQIDIGPYALWILLSIIIVNALCITAFYKEFIFTIFDPESAKIQGFKPTHLYYLLMILTSITTVGAFDCVGSLVVVSLMITPAATAYLFCSRVESMIKTSIIVSLVTSCAGYCIACIADLSIAGAIAATNGVVFLYAIVFKRVQAYLLKNSLI